MSRLRTGGRLRLAVVAGVPVYLSASWLVVAAALTLLFGPIAARVTGLDPVGGHVVAFALTLVLAVSVLAHEAAHAVAARLHGLEVTEVVVTLLGGHTLLGRPGTPRAAAVVAVVGPLTNLVLAGLAWAARPLVPQAEPGSTAAVLLFLLGGAALTNAFVGAFNLVPGLPLDGGQVLEALVWRLSGDRDAGTVVAAWTGRVTAVAVAAWFVLPPLLQGRLPDTITLVWVTLVSLSLWRGASAALRVARFRRLAARVDLRAVTHPVAVAHDRGSLTSLGEDLAAQGLDPHHETVVVDSAGRPVALVQGGSVAAVPPELWSTTPVSAVALALPPGSVVPARRGPVGAVEALAGVGHLGVVLVDDAGRPLGRVRPDEFAAAMGLR